jgi:hypothetical protein
LVYSEGGAELASQQIIVRNGVGLPTLGHVGAVAKRRIAVAIRWGLDADVLERSTEY